MANPKNAKVIVIILVDSGVLENFSPVHDI